MRRLVFCLLLVACAGDAHPPGEPALVARVVGSGSPTIVMDGGIGSRSEEWQAIQDILAESHRVVVYDRAGYGASPPGPLPRDAGREADELAALLRDRSIFGPLVLVGHSLGAMNVQLFAARHPHEVAGMVLLDPPPLSWLLGGSYPELRRMADRMTAEWQTLAEAGGEQAAFFEAIASEHREMFGRSAELVAAIESFGDLPLLVIASGRPNELFGEVADDYQRYWIEQSRIVAGRSSRGTFVLAEESSHQLHRDAPDLVVESVRATVRSRSAGTPRG